MRIEAIPLLADNYAWLLTGADGRCAVVDPSEGAPVVSLLGARSLSLQAVLLTHHHHDHIGGVEALVDQWPEARVFGSFHDADLRRIPRQTHRLVDDQTIEVLGAKGRCLHVPGHTLGAVAYYFADVGAVFTGDTLFTAGCGRLFEGTAAQLHQSLQRLASLPDTTQIYCGHEYTEKNLRFAQSVFPDDPQIAARLAEVYELRRLSRPTVPSPLAIERRTNPFLRAHEPDLAQRLGLSPGEPTFAELRRRRDSF